MTHYSFDPVLLSKTENLWLLENLEKPAVVALQTVPMGANPKTLRGVLDMVRELTELQAAGRLTWKGPDAIRGAIRKWLEQDSKWEADWQRFGGKIPRYPSLYSFDSKGRPHRAGPGSDNGRVRTYFGPAGERIPFAVNLLEIDESVWKGPTDDDNTVVIKPGVDRLVVDGNLHRIECFCGHTEQYREGSRASYNAARARMSKHLRKATDETERHRELHTAEFGG